PQTIQAPSVCNNTVCLVDFMATMAEILEVDLPNNMGEDSVSQLGLWQGKNEEIREALIHQSIDGSLAIRKGKYKLEMCKGSGGWSWPRPESLEEEGLMDIQLYDLEEDIKESQNIGDKHPEVVEELKEMLKEQVLRGRSTPGVPQVNDGEGIWHSIRWIQEGK
ncbi:MAG: arylsulfatase, partial [Cellulosilyticaceae bacterium]